MTNMTPTYGDSGHGIDLEILHHLETRIQQRQGRKNSSHVIRPSLTVHLAKATFGSGVENEVARSDAREELS